MGSLDKAMEEGQGVVLEFEPPNVEVSSISVTPNQCLISSEITLKIEFQMDKPLSNASWEIKYIVDYTNKRKELVMGRVEVGEYVANTPLSMDFSVPKVDVSGIRESLLLNVGLLLA